MTTHTQSQPQTASNWSPPTNQLEVQSPATAQASQTVSHPLQSRPFVLPLPPASGGPTDIQAKPEKLQESLIDLTKVNLFAGAPPPQPPATPNPVVQAKCAASETAEKEPPIALQTKSDERSPTTLQSLLGAHQPMLPKQPSIAPKAQVYQKSAIDLIDVPLSSPTKSRLQTFPAAPAPSVIPSIQRQTTDAPAEANADIEDEDVAIQRPTPEPQTEAQSQQTPVDSQPATLTSSDAANTQQSLPSLLAESGQATQSAPTDELTTSEPSSSTSELDSIPLASPQETAASKPKNTSQEPDKKTISALENSSETVSVESPSAPASVPAAISQATVGLASNTDQAGTDIVDLPVNGAAVEAAPQQVTPAQPAESLTASTPAALSLPDLQVPSAHTQGSQTVLDQITTAASSARPRFLERITQGTEAIAATVQQQQTALITASDSQTATIQALFTDARIQVGQIISSAQAQIQTDAASHLATSQQGHSTALGEVGTTFSSRQQSAQELGNRYAEEALQAADNSASQVQSRLAGMVAEARAVGRAKAQVGGSTPEIAQAKAQAATEIASDTASKITAGTASAMQDLRATGPDTATGFRAQGQEAASQLGQGQGQVVAQLNTSHQETVTAVQQAITQGTQALDSLQEQLVGQLTTLEQTIQNQLQTQVAEQSQALYDAGEQAIATFQTQGQQAITSGDEHLVHFSQQIAAMAIDPELATEVTTEIVGNVEGAYDDMMLTADDAFQQTDGALKEVGNQVLAAIDSASDEANNQIQTFLGQTQEQVNQQVVSMSAQLGQAVGQATDAESGMVTELASGLDEQINQLDSSFGEGLQQYTGGLDEQVTSAEAQAREPKQDLTTRIDTAQQRAEERAQQGFWERQWNDFWDMVRSPGFLAGLIAGLVLGAIVVALVIGGVLTGGVAIVAAMAVVGALSALAATIATNYSEGKRGWDLFEGAAENMLWGAGAGAVLTVVGLALAGAGVGLVGIAIGTSVTAGIITVVDNVCHDRPWDQGLVANMALAGILAWIGGKVAGRFSGSGRSPTAGHGGRTGGPPTDTPEPVRPPADSPEPVRPPADTPEPVRPPTDSSEPVRPPNDTPESSRSPEDGPSSNRPPRTTELPPEEVSRLVSERSDGTFRLNRKNISNASKIVGEPEAVVAEHAAREAYAAERAASMHNVERVYMGQAADEMINPGARPGTELSADVVGVTRRGRYVIVESKGTEILHGLEQLEHSGNVLGREQVVRYEIVVAEEIRTPGFTIENRILYLNGEPYLINGRPVHVRTTTSTTQ